MTSSQEYSEKIYKNAKHLYESAAILFNYERYLHSAHFAALSLEECTKCLMFIPEIAELFQDNQKFRHSSKYDLISIFRYIAGGCAVLYTIRKALSLGYDWDLKYKEKDHDFLIDKLSASIGITSLSCLAREIKVLLAEGWCKEKVFPDYNKIRTNSVYVDILDSKILEPDARLEQYEIHAIIDEARFAVGLLEMIIFQKFDWDNFADIYPTRYENLDEESDKMLSDIKGKKITKEVLLSWKK